MESPTNPNWIWQKKKDVRNYFTQEADGKFQSAYSQRNCIDWLFKIQNSPWNPFVNEKAIRQNYEEQKEVSPCSKHLERMKEPADEKDFGTNIDRT